MSRRLDVARSLGALVLLAQCVMANALFTPTETEIFNLSISPFTVTVLDGDIPNATNQGPKTTFQDLTFDKFDAGLGDLLAVEVTYKSTLGGTLKLDVKFSPFFSDNQTAGSFDVSDSNTVKLSGSGLNQSSTESVGSLKCIYPTNFDSSGVCALSVPNTFPFDSIGPITLGPAGFVGPGTFVLTATLESSMTPSIQPTGVDNPVDFFADNSTMTGTLSTNWDGSVSVRYEYEPRSTAVPEPMTLYLLLAGAAGMALLRRRGTFVHAKRAHW